ncbi:MAG TPA: hypothetical protein PKA88_12065 [Polyangiaceae bacterium]|nr:hypothetical protein [Polyangiaceae bacterium]HMR79648.1 hypothetical protein [Polyangiaceae bacterium]
MLKLDEFASVFKSASKRRFEAREVSLGRVLVVTDLSAEDTRLFTSDLKQFLSVVGDDAEFLEMSGDEFDNVGQTLERVERDRPDLIVAYRNVKGRAKHFPFSLGSHVDVLTQATSTPVLLVPLPDEAGRLSSRCENTDRVMVLTDHLTGSDALVSYGQHITQTGGTLCLAHLEDDKILARYMEVISKIPSIDTDEAGVDIPEQLLKEPRDYVRSCQQALAVSRPDLKVDSVVRMGHHIADCQRLVEEYEIDVLVMNTKDEDQLAMSGLAYPIAVEFRELPLLLL